MASLRERGRVWYFEYSDADGVKHEVKGCTDRRATEELARQAESEAAKIRAGLIDPRDTGYRDHAARPLVEHLHDCAAALLGRRPQVEHANLYRPVQPRLPN